MRSSVSLQSRAWSRSSRTTRAVFLEVERTAAPRAERYRGIPHSPLPTEGWHDADVPGGYEVMLFRADGWLTMLDLVGYSEDPLPSEFPPPAEMEVRTSEGPGAWPRPPA
jgi:hypothetical protein